jgi:hypothetical protein
MSTVGGALGICSGIPGPAAAFDIPISWHSMVPALVLALTVGVTFGLLPAAAAKLNPSEVSRYE